MKTMKIILGISFVFSSLAMAGTFDDQPRVSETCEAFLYARVDKELPKNQFVSQMRLRAVNSNIVDLEITLDQGNDNFCLKTGTAVIKDKKNSVCEINEVEISTDNFDCG